MKKAYIAPSVEVVNFEVQSQILSASTTIGVSQNSSIGSNDDLGGNDYNRSKENSMWHWLDEEEE